MALPATLPAAYRPSRSRTHRLSAHLPTLSSPFSSFNSSALAGLAPPPLAHLAEHPGRGEGQTRRNHGPARIAVWEDPVELPVAASPAAAATTVQVPPVEHLSGFTVLAHPNDSPLLGAPLELTSSASSGSSSPIAGGTAGKRPSSSHLLLPLPAPAVPKRFKSSPAPTPLSPTLSSVANNLASSRRGGSSLSSGVGSAFGGRHSKRHSARLSRQVDLDGDGGVKENLPPLVSHAQGGYHPSTPSVDITSSFPSLAALSSSSSLDLDADSDLGLGLGLGLGIDDPSSSSSSSFISSGPPTPAEELFDEAFPTPTLGPSSSSPSASSLLLRERLEEQKAAYQHQHHRRRSTGPRELELVKRMSWESEPGTAAGVGREAEGLLQEEAEERDEGRFEDAEEDEPLLHIRRRSPSPSPPPSSSSPTAPGIGLGLGIEFDTALPAVDAAAAIEGGEAVAHGLGLGIDLGRVEGENKAVGAEKREVVKHISVVFPHALDLPEADNLDALAFPDPETPLLPAVERSIPRLPSLSSSPKKALLRTSPRGKKTRPARLSAKAKPSVGLGGTRRVYPRMGGFEKGERERRGEMHGQGLALNPLSPEDRYYPASPTLDSLPGAFRPILASPVLPTSFSDYSHSPLPTPIPPTRFSLVRRAQQQSQTAALPTFVPPISVNATCTTTSSASATTTTGPASSALLLATSPAGTPAVTASPTFSPSLAPAAVLSSAEAATPTPSAPSTPVPDQAAFASSAAAASSTSAGAAAAPMSQAVFDAAIASTILGAVAAIGVLGWLAVSVFRRKKQSGEGGQAHLSVKQLEYHEKDDYPDSSASSPVLTSFPTVPPVARLSLLSHPHSAPSSRQGSPTADRTFSSHFSGWIDVPPPSAGAATEDHGGYPGEVMRFDGMSTYERRMSRQSRASVVSGYTTAPSSARHARGATGGGGGGGGGTTRSSYARSSVADSTWSAGTGFRPGTVVSSRTSQHGPGSEYCFRPDADAGAPPRLPESLPTRVSGDASTYFATPPGTPTKREERMQQQRNSTLAKLTGAVSAVDEPPVPSLPAVYAVPPVPSSARPATTRSSTRPRSNSRSTGASSKQLPLKSALKSHPALSTAAKDDGDDSPTESAIRKLERRRATVDAAGGASGGILADGLQALLFQQQVEESAAAMAALSGHKDSGDVFASSTPSTGGSGGPTKSGSKRSSLGRSVRSGTASSASGSISAKMLRPQTMPPKIVVSGHLPPSPTLPSPSSRSASPSSAAKTPSPARKRTSTTDTDILSARASMKTLDAAVADSLPWLSKSGSTATTFSAYAGQTRDDISVVDPDMRFERKHFSTGTLSSSAFTPESTPNRASKDLSSFVAAGLATTSRQTPPPLPSSVSSAAKHGTLDSVDIAARRLASEDDLASQTSLAGLDDDERSGDQGGRDSDSEAAVRSQRRKTLLYSVYKQRGVDLTPSPSPPSTVSPAATLASRTGTGTTDSEDSSTDSPTKGAARVALVSSFPSPPPVPTTSSTAKRLSSGPIDVDLSRYAPKVVTEEERDITSAMDEVRNASSAAAGPFLSVSPSSASAPPPRPPKSPVRLSAQLLGETTSTPPSTSLPAIPPSTTSRSPTLASRITARQPFAPLSGNAPRSTLPNALGKPAVTSAPLRSFAAELQESVGTPADGYDSDTLMAATLFNKPGHSLWSAINGPGGHAALDSLSVSASSSAYGDFSASASLSTSSPHGSGMYSTSPGSIESLEEAAIAQAERRQFGGRASGTASQFMWRRTPPTVVSESEESVYEESDAETLAWRTRMGTMA